ncbi:MAG: hypothetical protein ABSD58_17285 [Verrucomicrobiia bacterium]
MEVNKSGGAPRGYVFVQERQFLQPVNSKTVTVNNVTINKTVINKKGPATAVIEKASGRKIEAVPVRELRNKEEAKAVAKRPTPTSIGEKAAQTPVRSQAEKALPASEPRQVEKPTVTTTEPQAATAKKEAQQAEQIRIAKLDAEKRAQQATVRETESEKVKSVPAAAEAKPEAKREATPEAKAESKPAVERPAATMEPTEQKTDKNDEKKD